MTKEQAIKRAHEIVGETSRTAMVFVKLSKGEPSDWCAGSAFDSTPRGWRPHTFVSVTGLERPIG